MLWSYMVYDIIPHSCFLKTFDCFYYSNSMQCSPQSFCRCLFLYCLAALELSGVDLEALLFSVSIMWYVKPNDSSHSSYTPVARSSAQKNIAKAGRTLRASGMRLLQKRQEIGHDLRAVQANLQRVTIVRSEPRNLNGRDISCQYHFKSPWHTSLQAHSYPAIINRHVSTSVKECANSWANGRLSFHFYCATWGEKLQSWK